MTFSGTNPNVLDLCRLCLGKDDSLIPVFDCLQSDKILSDKINVCLAIQISADDRISQKICGSCLIKVDSFYEFRNTTSESQKVLERWLQDLDSLLANSNSKEADINHKEVNYNYSIENSSGGEHTDNESETTSYESSSLEDNDTPIQEQQGQNMVEMDLAQTDIINILPSTAPGPSGLQPTDEEALLECDCSMASRHHGNEGGNLEYGETVIDIVKSNLNDLHPQKKVPLLIKESESTDGVIKKSIKKSLQKICNPNEIAKGIPTLQSNNEGTVKVKQKFECSICQFTAKYKSQLEIHLKRHKKDYRLFCSICHRGFFYQHEIEMHEAVHKEEKRFECSVCQKKFVYRHTLVAHVKKHEICLNNSNCEKEKFQCDTCGKTFSNKSYLRKHSLIHSGINKVICDICGIILSNSIVLKSHHRTHTGERPYLCKTCGRSFNTKKYMTVHMRTHTGIKPFKCQTCGKSFSQQSTLTVHKRYHTGERPYECHICKKSFVTKTILKLHQQRHSF